MHKVRKAVFPVGGMGTRFLPATKSMPKEMLPIASKPLIQHAFEEAKAAGIEEFIFITSRNKDAINNHFDHVFELEYTLNAMEKDEALNKTCGWLPEAGKVMFIRQQQPLGLGHAVWCARHAIGNEPFAVLLADELFIMNDKVSALGEMLEVYRKNPGNIIAVADVGMELVSNYGIISYTDDDGTAMKINGMLEKPHPSLAPSSLAIAGRYILQPEIFDIIAKQGIGLNEEVQLTDAMRSLLQQQPFMGMRINGRRFDCGNPLGYLQANIEMALLNPSLRDQLRDILLFALKNTNIS